MLDVAFDFSGQYLLSASADGTARVYNATTHQLISKLEGHESEISKVSFMWSQSVSGNRNEIPAMNWFFIVLLYFTI